MLGLIKKLFPRKRRKYSLALLLSMSILGALAGSVISGICIYNSFFTRYERPDYDLYPGMYDYQRYEGSLPRETLTVKNGMADLAAYYYPVDAPKGLVVTVHGYHAGADDLLPVIEAVVAEGYAVFAYDATGTYSSGGENGVGMCQSLLDLDVVLSWLSCTAPYDQMPKLLLGHSLGGYAVTSVLALHPEVKACAAISPVCDANTLMVERSVEVTNGLAYTIKPVFDVYQKHLFGDYTQYNAVIGINSVDIPVLIAQGKEDTVISPDGLSVTAYLEELTNPNVTVYYTSGVQGTHMGILHSEAAEAYILSVNEILEDMETEMGGKLKPAAVTAVYKTVDHRLYSEVNPDLMEQIFETFEKGLK